MPANYKFEENLLKGSHSKKYDEAIKEWHEVMRVPFPKENPQLCICQHNIRDVIIIYNSTTKKTIFVGSGYIKKFDSYKDNTMVFH